MKRLLLALACMACTVPALATSAGGTGCPETSLPHLPQRSMRVGVKYAPPFVVDTGAGQWAGLGIDLWQAVSACLKMRVAYVEYATVEDLLDAAARNEVDVAVGALSVNSERASAVDFTPAFHVGSLGAVVPAGPRRPAMATAAAHLMQPQVVAAAASLALATLLIAYGCWRLERRRGNVFFCEGPAQGLYQSLLWSVQLVFAGRGDPFSIRHRGGQLLVFALTFLGATVVSTMTALITSSLTLGGIDHHLRNASELGHKRIAVMASGRARDWAMGERMLPTQIRSWPEAQRKFDENAADALVHDRDILAYLVKERILHDVRLEPLRFDTQMYAFALPPGSPLRRPVDAAMLAVLESAAWPQMRTRWLGND